MNIISTALADSVSQGAPAQQGTMGSMVFLVGIFVAMYFLLIRPQNKRAKEHQKVVSQLTKGDEVITSGGIVGKIASLSDDFIGLAVSDNLTIMIQRHAISKTLPKGTIKSIA